MVVGTITTEFGDVMIELYPDAAPKTVENFKKLATSGFYDGLIFHRIVPGFVIQVEIPIQKIHATKVNGGQEVLVGTLKQNLIKIHIHVEYYLWQDRKIRIVQVHSSS
jgi:cyclophilin family peptidyl-prolyl cis-trans isomerase